ncbi:hypothetical protein GCM10023100_05920 [Actinocorallia cavernae]|uniref:Uncharacterized protein n=2 Tax=Actinomycetes TaxID=1760 RepID=A0ABP5YV05_9ACTN
MAEVPGRRTTVRGTGWPWEEPVARTSVRTAVDALLSRVWSLAALTMVVPAGGYAWLGFFAAGVSGALVGAVVGLLHVVADLAVSGRH